MTRLDVGFGANAGRWRRLHRPQDWLAGNKAIERESGVVMLKNLATFVVALVVSLAIGEAVLRAFTHFPVNDKSNKISDPELGYRLRPNAPGFDSHGFRNSEEKHGIYQVAALGDSHTYGINVSMDASWPGVFEEIAVVPTYNFGVSSYGILSYHAIVKKEIERGTKYIMLGLYPTNDFVKSWSYCTIDFKASEFWLSEIDRLDLKITNDIGVCADDGERGLTKWNRRQAWRYFKYNFALASAAHHLVFSKFKRPKEQEFYNFPSNIPPLLVNATLQHGNNVDLAVEEVGELYQLFEKFVADWASLSRESGAKIGILVIPSKTQVVYRVLESRGLVDQASPALVTSVRAQIAFEAELQELFRESGIPFRNAAEHLVSVLEDGLEKDITLFPVGDVHPLEPGYRAYADVAYELWGDMRAR